MKIQYKVLICGGCGYTGQWWKFSLISFLNPEWACPRCRHRIVLPDVSLAEIVMCPN